MSVWVLVVSGWVLVVSRRGVRILNLTWSVVIHTFCCSFYYCLLLLLLFVPGCGVVMNDSFAALT